MVAERLFMVASSKHVLNCRANGMHRLENITRESLARVRLYFSCHITTKAPLNVIRGHLFSNSQISAYKCPTVRSNLTKDRIPQIHLYTHPGY